MPQGGKKLITTNYVKKLQFLIFYTSIVKQTSLSYEDVEPLVNKTPPGDKTMKKFSSLLVICILFAMIAAACQPETIIQTVEVEKIVEGTPVTVIQTVEVEKIVEATGPTEINVWSHFANEPLFRQVVQKVFDDYMVAHPDVVIKVAWFDKDPLRQSIQTVMQSGGEGAPDITTFDTYDVSWVEAGWIEPLDDVLDPKRFVPGAIDEARYPDLGFPEAYKFNTAFTVDYLLYNREIFDELGIVVPDNAQFSQDEFLEVVKKCDTAGYAGFANGGGNRPFPGQYISKAALLSLVGPKEFNEYWTGKKSWDTPEVRQALNWVVELGKNGLWNDSFATMTLDEAHLYFHTQKKACMFMNGSWYTSRAFKDEASGGQSPDFRFGMLKYPLMDGATSPNSIVGLFPTGYIVLSTGQYKDIAKDILKFWADDPTYAAMWAGLSNTASAIAFSSEDVPADLKENPWQWYWDEFNAVYGDVEPIVPGAACGDFNDALTSVLNQGIPLGLLSVDEAIATLDAKLCK